jgi:hypothetical protein
LFLFFFSFLITCFPPRHVKVCKKVFCQHRKQFDSAKHRAEGTELASYLNSKRRFGGGGGGGNSSSKTRQSTSTMKETMSSNKPKNPNNNSRGGGGSQLPTWKAQSLEFRKAMREAKIVSQAEQRSKATGIPLHQLLPPPSGSNRNSGGGQQSRSGPPAGYVQCPHCGRSYNQQAGARHIPKV